MEKPLKKVSENDKTTPKKVEKAIEPTPPPKTPNGEAPANNPQRDEKKISEYAIEPTKPPIIEDKDKKEKDSPDPTGKPKAKEII